MSDKHHYKRLDVSGQQYVPVESHTAYARHIALPDGLRYFVLKQYRRKNYFVGDYRTWISALASIYKHTPRADLCAIARPPETALHQTAERFDTLEQAMLYFEMVRS